MNRPVLKDLRDLTAPDLEAHPVWVNVHIRDYDEPWYEDTHELTCRPWDGPLPLPEDQNLVLLSTQFTLADGTRLPGYLYVLFLSRGCTDMPSGNIQPVLFTPRGAHIGFWHGSFLSPPTKNRLYADLERPPSAIFPLRFVVEAGITHFECAGEIAGFYSVRSVET